MWLCHFIAWLTALRRIHLRNLDRFICHTEERRHPPNSDNLRTRVSRENPDRHQRLQKLKASLNAAYECINKANKRCTKLYERRAKLRKFKVGDLVCLYSPGMKPGLFRKFNKPRSGPHKITSELPT